MHVYMRGDWKQRLRLSSGLVLFAFAGTHFLNHAVGLVGLEAMHHVQAWRTTVTRSLPGSLVLLVALVTHIVFGLEKLARRTTWQLPLWEAIQVGSGLAIPFLLLPHIVNTRVAHLLFGVEDSYLYELARLWPASAVQQSALLLLVWAHGCIGIHYWLRLSPSYRGLAPWLLPLAIILPLAALAGFVVSGMITGDILTDPLSMAELKARSNWPDSAASETLAGWRLAMRIAFGLAAVTAIVLAVARIRREMRGDAHVPITYGDGRIVRVLPGQTILEASRAAGVPHASVCGGRARCSTCRIRIDGGQASLAPPSEGEALTLRSIEAPANVRLACQVRPTAPLSISLISAPGTPLPIEHEFGLVKEAVACHLRAALTGQTLEFATGDSGSVSEWLELHAGYRVPPIPLDNDSARLAGARIDYLDSDRVGVVVFSRGEDRISVFALPISAERPRSVRAVRNGYRVLGWTDDRLSYVLVADPAFAEVSLREEANDEVEQISEIERLLQRSRSLVGGLPESRPPKIL